MLKNIVENILPESYERNNNGSLFENQMWFHHFCHMDQYRLVHDKCG